MISDREIVRAGLSSMLTRAGAEVLGHFPSEGEFLPMARTRPPDVVVMCMHGPGLTLARACATMLDHGPTLQIGALTEEADQRTTRSFLACGGKAVLAKDASSAHIIEMVRTLAAGRFYFGHEILAALVGWMIDARGAGPDPGRITWIEQLVLAFSADGLSDREIANRLKVDERYARAHMRRAMNKLNARSRAEAVREAFKIKVLT